MNLLSYTLLSKKGTNTNGLNAGAKTTKERGLYASRFPVRAIGMDCALKQLSLLAFVLWIRVPWKPGACVLLLVPVGATAQTEHAAANWKMTVIKKEIQADYKNRINRVFQYIDENLDSDLSLNTIAEVACFSPFHFHRVFRFVTSETLNEYVTRRRIEKCALELLHKDIAIAELSLKYGFSDNSSFTRIFRKFYKVSPTEFRKQNTNRFSKIRQLKSKNGQPYPDNEKYICVINDLKNWIKMNAKIEIREMPRMDLAYVSSIGPQNLGSAYQKLIQWATPRGLMNEKTQPVTIYHDSFKVTEENKVRMSACIRLSKSVETEGEVGLTSIASGKFIVGSFEIALSEFEKSWTGLFVWMNENGYKKADREPFEIYHNNFKDHPEKKVNVDFYIPIL